MSEADHAPARQRQDQLEASEPRAQPGAQEVIPGLRYLSVEQHIGPLPHPSVLREYEQVESGLAGKIVDMAIAEQAHRHEMDRADREVERLKVVQPFRIAVIGRRYAIGAMVVVLGFAAWLIYIGHAAIGGTFATIDIVGLVLAFIAGQAQSADEPADSENPTE